MNGRDELQDGPDFGGFAADLAAIMASPTSPDMERRIDDERRATRTPKQRARKAVRTEQLNFRVSAETKALLFALAAETQLSATDIVVQAIEDMAKRKKVTVPRS
jgi:hypothetical protein